MSADRLHYSAYGGRPRAPKGGPRRLTAAAPELLAALKAVLALPGFAKTYGLTDALREAHAAIAKAEGPEVAA